MQRMQDLVVAWTEDDGTRCVLSGDDNRLALRVIRANGQVIHVEPVADVMQALQVRATQLRAHAEAAVGERVYDH
jgi:hypothetical protein